MFSIYRKNGEIVIWEDSPRTYHLAILKTKATGDFSEWLIDIKTGEEKGLKRVKKMNILSYSKPNKNLMIARYGIYREF